jgi:hypothetical protein
MPKPETIKHDILRGSRVNLLEQLETKIDEGWNILVFLSSDNDYYHILICK